MHSFEDLPKENQIDEHAADHAIEKPFEPEEPSPLGTERGEDADGQHEERDDQLLLIALKCTEAQYAGARGEVVEIGEAKESWKEDEEPGAQLAFALQLQCRGREEQSDDNDGEKRAHKVGMSRIAGIGSGRLQHDCSRALTWYFPRLQSAGATQKDCVLTRFCLGCFEVFSARMNRAPMPFPFEARLEQIPPVVREDIRPGR